MTTSVKYEIFWLLAILATVFLLFGLLTSFHFSAIPIRLYDATYLIPAFGYLLFTFLWGTLVTVGIREIKYNFQRRLPVIILVLCNSAVFLFTCFVLYGLFAITLFGGLIDGLINSEQAGTVKSPLLKLIKHLQLTGFICLVLLGTVEVLLIKRLKSINRWWKTNQRMVESNM